MYITVNDIIGEKRIDLVYPIQGKEVAVVIMLSDNVQYLLKEPVKVLLKMGQNVELSKGVFTDKELDALIGFEKVRISHREYALRVNKLEHITEMTINLDKLDNTNNLKDGRPSDALFMYYVPAVKDFIHFEPHTPQYKKLKNGEIVSLTLIITDQNNNVITNGPGTTVVLHIQ